MTTIRRLPGSKAMQTLFTLNEVKAANPGLMSGAGPGRQAKLTVFFGTLYPLTRRQNSRQGRVVGNRGDWGMIQHGKVSP